MCLYRNESVHTYDRDVNTIYVGRYMVEREKFPDGFNQDECVALRVCACVLVCASLRHPH